MRTARIHSMRTRHSVPSAGLVYVRRYWLLFRTCLDNIIGQIFVYSMLYLLQKKLDSCKISLIPFVYPKSTTIVRCQPLSCLLFSCQSSQTHAQQFSIVSFRNGHWLVPITCCRHFSGQREHPPSVSHLLNEDNSKVKMPSGNGRQSLSTP